MNLAELKQERASKVDAQKKLLDARSAESRSFTEAETKQFNDLDEEIRNLDGRIEQAEREEQAAQRAAQQQRAQQQQDRTHAKQQKEQRELNSYSLHKAVNAQLEGRNQDGLEAELHQEAQKEARENGQSIEGVGIPRAMAVRMIKGPQAEKRDMTAGTDADGGFMVPTEVEETVIQALRPRLVTAQMGAETMGNLEGDISMPRTSGVTVGWKAETGDAADGQPTIDEVTLSPKRVTAFTDLSRQLVRQSSPDVEALIRNDFFSAVANAIDKAALVGGGSNEPVGILSDSNINIVYAGGATSAGANANGAAPKRADLVNLEKAVALENADLGRLGYVTNAKVRAFLKNLEVSSGSGRFAWDGANSEVMGYPAMTTSNVPSNLSKGTSNDLSAIIFGNFRDLLIGQWGGLDLIVNPYTKAKKGTIEMIVHQYVDVALRHSKSFAAVKDADAQ